VFDIPIAVRHSPPLLLLYTLAETARESHGNIHDILDKEKKGKIEKFIKCTRFS